MNEQSSWNFYIEQPTAEQCVRCPDYSGWQVEIVRGGLTIRPFVGNEPNAFNRFMQRLILGFRWSRVA